MKQIRCRGRGNATIHALLDCSAQRTVRIVKKRLPLKKNIERFCLKILYELKEPDKRRLRRYGLQDGAVLRLGPRRHEGLLVGHFLLRAGAFAPHVEKAAQWEDVVAVLIVVGNVIGVG